MANSEIIGAGKDTARRAPKKYPPVLDVCCSNRSMWFDAKDERAIFCDLRNEVYKYTIPTRKGVYDCSIVPDVRCSFCALPFPDETFYMVGFDPPHLRVGETSYTAKRYGRLSVDFEQEMTLAFSECFRVLRPFGTLIFKWNEHDVALSTVLPLAGVKPLFGQRRGGGKHGNTYWVAFMKQESPVLGEESPAQNTMEICHTAPNSASPKAAQISMELEL